MCRAYSDDSPTIHRVRLVDAARKRHRCNECGRYIDRGEPYRYTFLVCEGAGYTFHTCQHCMVGQQWLVQICPGNYALDELDDELEEHAAEYSAIAEPLRDLVAGMKRHWRRQGRLMPVPTVPPAITPEMIGE